MLKKYLYLLLIAFSVVFTACDKENDEPEYPGVMNLHRIFLLTVKYW